MAVRREPLEVDLEDTPDLAELAEKVDRDKEPRIIRRRGRMLAVLVSPRDWRPSRLVRHSPEDRARAIKAAGGWADLDTDKMIEELYRARNEAPPSPPVDL